MIFGAPTPGFLLWSWAQILQNPRSPQKVSELPADLLRGAYRTKMYPLLQLPALVQGEAPSVDPRFARVSTPFEDH